MIAFRSFAFRAAAGFDGRIIHFGLGNKGETGTVSTG